MPMQKTYRKLKFPVGTREAQLQLFGYTVTALEGRSVSTNERAWFQKLFLMSESENPSGPMADPQTLVTALDLALKNLCLDECAVTGMTKLYFQQ